jgi:hypothetical protein
MRIRNKDRSPVRVHSGNTAAGPTRFAKFVRNDFLGPLHALDSACFSLYTAMKKIVLQRSSGGTPDGETHIRGRLRKLTFGRWINQRSRSGSRLRASVCEYREAPGNRRQL